MNKSATEQASIDKPLAQLDDYRLLGSSGLRVSPLCLGAMTFGTNWGVRYKNTQCAFNSSHDNSGRDGGSNGAQGSRKASAYLTTTSKRAATSSIRPTSTPTAPVSSTWVSWWRRFAARWWWPPSTASIRPFLVFRYQCSTISSLVCPGASSSDCVATPPLPAFTHGQERQLRRQSPQGHGAGA